MKARSTYIGILFMLFLIFHPAGAETLTLGEAVSRILVTNPDITKAQRSVLRADDDIEPVFSLEKSKITIGASYADSINEEDDNGVGDTTDTSGTSSQSQTEDRGWSLPIDGSVSLSVPIFPQVSLSGSVSSDASGDVSLSLSPFASPNRTPAQIEAYQKALVKLDYLQREIAAQAEAAVLNYLETQRELAYAQDALSVEEEVYAIARQSYDLGETTLTELQDASTELNTVRQSYYTAQKNRLEAAKTLKLLLGPETESPEIAPIDIEELQALISTRANELTAKDGSEPTSESLDSYLVTLDSLQEQLKDTWAWRPGFSVSGKISIPETSFTIQTSLSFSPSDLGIDSRRDLKDSIDDTAEDIATEKYLLALETELARQSVEITERALDSALTEIEQAKVLLEETRLLHDAGERTDTELRQSELSLKKSENAAFQQAMNLLKAQNDYLLLLPRD